MKHLFSTDHKIIGIQYGLASFLFLFLGFSFVLLMRWQLAFPEGGSLTPELYNQFGAMHGTIMVFLGIVPLGVGAFGNYLIPLQIGAKDMAFPRMNAWSFWIFLVSGLFMLSSFLLPGGAPSSGWTSYPPLSSLAGSSQTFWLVGMLGLIVSSLLGSLNFIVTIFHHRAKGIGFFELPIFIWTELVSSFLLLLAFPPLGSACLLQLCDRLLGTSFFLPSGLFVSGEMLKVAGGGNPLLWQHLFWFLAHPEVYVLILPALGIVCEVLTCHCRKSIYGYKTVVYSLLFLGFMSMLVWAHHMFLTGMGSKMSQFFQATTLIISIPSVVLITSLLLTLWGSQIHFRTASLFALGFLPMFGIGGLTGLPLGLAASDLHLHDTYYVIGHFHYVVAPGSLFALFAGVYHWYPKVFGRFLNEWLGKIHFFGSFIGMNLVFFPMFFVGIAGVSRRMFDMTVYNFSRPIQNLNVLMSAGSIVLLLFQLPFLLNLILSFFRKEKAPQNPWQCSTLEWAHG